ncbi:MAG: hypothetical protein KF770_13360 [Anaerolineae bacterium]|nr:hypothetical protein [Anaerolineae bacterium]
MDIITQTQTTEAADTAVPVGALPVGAVPGQPEPANGEDTAVSRPEQQQAQDTAVPGQLEANKVLRELYLQQDRRPALTRKFYRAVTQAGLVSGVWVDVEAAIEKLGFTIWGEHIIENLETDGMITIDAIVGFEGEPARRYHLTNRALTFMDEIFEQEEQARRGQGTAITDEELALARRAKQYGVSPARLKRWDKIHILNGLTNAQIAEREGVEEQTIKKDKKAMRDKGYTYP